nr:MAG TPA: repressor protein [Caudoviricetes sp.]
MSRTIVLTLAIKCNGFSKLFKPAGQPKKFLANSVNLGYDKRMNHKEWLEKTTVDSVNAIAKKINVKQRTLAAQLDRDRLTPENVIKIAEHYGNHPVGALVETGYLSEKWASGIDPFLAVRKLTDEQILEEILRRLKLPGDHREFVTPIDELVEERQGKLRSVAGNVTPLPHTDIHAPLPDLDALDYVAQHDHDQPTIDEYVDNYNRP